VATGAAAPGRETIVELYADDAVFVAGEGVKGREAIEVDACAIYYDQTRRRRHAATRQIGGGSMMYDLATLIWKLPVPRGGLSSRSALSGALSDRLEAWNLEPVRLLR